MMDRCGSDRELYSHAGAWEQGKHARHTIKRPAVYSRRAKYYPRYMSDARYFPAGVGAGVGTACGTETVSAAAPPS
jgi:hypothetical protein